jgi:hypothetical protein
LGIGSRQFPDCTSGRPLCNEGRRPDGRSKDPDLMILHAFSYIIIPIPEQRLQFHNSGPSEGLQELLPCTRTHHQTRCSSPPSFPEADLNYANKRFLAGDHRTNLNCRLHTCVYQFHYKSVNLGRRDREQQASRGLRVVK